MSVIHRLIDDHLAARWSWKASISRHWTRMAGCSAVTGFFGRLPARETAA